MCGTPGLIASKRLSAALSVKHSSLRPSLSEAVLGTVAVCCAEDRETRLNWPPDLGLADGHADTVSALDAH